MCVEFSLQILFVLWATSLTTGFPNIIERTHNSGGPFWLQHDAFDCLAASQNVTFDPLCASDGQTFQNSLAIRCYMQFFKTQLTARRGVCSERRHPDHCAFAFIVWRRVCGDDNVTYSSIWELLCTADRLGKPISMQHEGPCRLHCGMALEYRPVCGSDGVQYPNQEALSCQALRHPDLNLTAVEDCQMSRGQICLWGSTGYAGSPDTGRDLPPVCATNGITYPNYFSVECLSETNANLDIEHDGPCLHADVHRAIQRWEEANPGMSCQLAEAHVLWLPVCTNEGRTFSSEMRWHCALVQGVIEPESIIASHGECEQKNDAGVTEDGENSEVTEASPTSASYKVWPENHLDPCSPKNDSSSLIVDHPILCASDGGTYYTIREFACAKKKNGHWFPYSIVSYGAPCQPANTACERMRSDPEALASSPICASDKTTYANPLALMCAMSRDAGIQMKHIGKCISSD